MIDGAHDNHERRLVMIDGAHDMTKNVTFVMIDGAHDMTIKSYVLS